MKACVLVVAAFVDAVKNLADATPHNVEAAKGDNTCITSTQLDLINASQAMIPLLDKMLTAVKQSTASALAELYMASTKANFYPNSSP